MLKPTMINTAASLRYLGRVPVRSCPLRYHSSSSYIMDIPPLKRKHVPTSGTYPQGFLVASAHAGVKASSPAAKPDVALLCSRSPCSGAAVFTTNKFQAAPVQVSKEALEVRGGDGVQAVVVNSGCANAVTGKAGLDDAKAMVRRVDELEKRDAKQPGTLVMSTGVIGQRLPLQKILNSLPDAHNSLASSHDAWLSVATAICTTDTYPKLLSRTFTLPSAPDRVYSIAGVTKGAGMIHPNMATLLGIICTDAPVEPVALKPLLTHAVSRSFNRISIDGDTSTNDTIAILANGAAGGTPISLAPTSSSSTASADYITFQNELTSFAQSLSHLVVRDGEGATKFATVRVRNCPSHADAQRIASSIACSPLVKTALYGKDANWGRILCSIGYAAGVHPDSVVPERTSVSFAPIDGKSTELKLVVNGEPEQVDEERAADILKEEDLEISVDLNGGAKGEAGKGGEDGIYWFCDFSHDYVTINGDYRT